MGEWLPPLCLFEDHGSDWTRYEEYLYGLFRRDFLVRPPRIGRETVRINTAPVVNGKEESFWHLVTEEETVIRDGRAIRDRVPHFRRCERICWPGAILRQGEGERVRVWQERRADGLRIVHALPDFSYLVSIAVRQHGKLFLATAFPVELSGRRERLRKQYERFQREGIP